MADPNKLMMEIAKDHYGYYVAFRTRAGRLVSEGNGSSVEHAAYAAIKELELTTQDAYDTLNRYLAGN